MRLRRSRAWCLVLTAILPVLVSAKCYGQLPTASQIFDRYAKAAGGDAVRAVRSRAMLGVVITPAGRAPLEIVSAAPDHFVRIIESPVSGRSENGWDGRIAWSRNASGVHEMNGPAVGMVLRELHLHRPAELKNFYASTQPPRPDTMGGKGVYVIAATTPDGVSETLSFDRGTGLLAGWEVSLSGTTIRSRIDEYRAVDGVMVPVRIIRSRPDFTWMEEFTTVTHNAPVDTLRFAKPGR